MNILTQNTQNPNSQFNAQPNTIQVNIQITMQSGNMNLNINIDPNCPFQDFISGVLDQIFKQKMESQYEETIEYQLDNGGIIKQNEQRTLKEMGFKSGCVLYVRLKLKGGQA